MYQNDDYDELQFLLLGRNSLIPLKNCTKDIKYGLYVK